MTEFAFALAIFIVLCILCVLSLLMSAAAIIMVLALKNSTHKIEWKSPFVGDDEGFLSGPALSKALNKKHEEIEEDFV